ncbi:efflux RND transporter periplasmic adaptor subunit [Shewanella sp. NIFS-20-20]|uniref:efflux RND transporter periplasmic adaptor subunit n=1 Tax=Shewanella sp. NIFS-20-20 TaxID=2853806 RepID=UPI001C45E145|nr:efflux RND transporter periplasmic adaptor subunit [Shewanella sp. NIFS-20-20]MBV7315292.1 efflux RND transporter periplasmic adaptor subunit [Shewanella sp. NIFS-20-20]
MNLLTHVSRPSLSVIALALSILWATPLQAGPGHDHDEVLPAVGAIEDAHEEGLHLSSAQLALAGIEVMALQDSHFNLDAVATANLIVDRDQTVILAPQLEVRVMARHVAPGQNVSQGQPLLTLGGAAVAQAQAEFINASAEWRRVKAMDNSAVSASRRLQAQVDAELKRAILASLKMTEAQIEALATQPERIGEYQLLAPIAGRVQQDIAQRGQVSAGGQALMQLTNESSLWVEAQLTPAQSSGLTVGSKALVRVDDKLLAATIIGRSHELDSVTRTEQVLARMDNPGHVLHAGQFAELYLTTSEQVGLVLPDAALTRSSDGHWQVFMVKGDAFEAVEVTVSQRQRGMNLVSGLPDEGEVVIAGAFLLASEQAKSGFDIHNH